MKGDGDENEFLSERDWFMAGDFNINIVALHGTCCL